ncbi:MAG: FAD-binding protein [Bacteroidales bacterium]|nr:FAD-binding protein [Bacteroidales bacterium]
MASELLVSFLKSKGIQYELNVDLKKRTWIHRGGLAHVFISPKCADDLENAVIYLYKNSIPFLLIGHTSNIYILNECNIPVVVSTAKCRNYKLVGDRLYCEAGVGVIQLSKQMINLGIKGFEYLTGLPGTVGAALVNNSSCRDNSISDLLISAKVVLNDGSIRTIQPKDFKFEFRNSVFKKKVIEGTIISVILKAECGDKSTMQEIAANNDLDRKRKLEGHAMNLGCTVHRCFINGKMSVWLKVSLLVYGLFSRLFIKTEEERRKRRRDYICYITGYKSIAPYVSFKNPIVFCWIDEGADVAFPRYLDFMNKIYKTDKVEIEIIRQWQK